MAAVLWPNGGTASPIFYRNTPSGFRWTSAFGWRTHPVTGQPQTFHYGLDMIGWSTIVAPVSGVVTFAGYNGGAGNEVRIREDGTGDVFRLLHNRELWVRTGQRVSQGQGVAVMGTTGSSTGVHCHEETRPGGGVAIDPLVYYSNRNAGAAGGGGGEPFPPEDEENNEMTKIIGNGEGSQKFADEFGVDDIGNYFFLPEGVNGNPSWVDNIRGAWLLATEPENGRPGTWDMELARHIGNARWDQKRGQIVTDTVNALRPLLDQIGQAVAGLSPETIKKAIDDGLAGVIVEPQPLDEATLARIAELSASATRQTLRDDPLTAS